MMTMTNLLVSLLEVAMPEDTEGEMLFEVYLDPILGPVVWEFWVLPAQQNPYIPILETTAHTAEMEV